MKVGFTSSPYLANKALALYVAAMTAVAGGILLLPAQTPTPNVAYNLFKIGQNSPDQTLVANGWKPIGYACQAANPQQIGLGFGSTVCGYKYKTASHNLITNAGIDWLACLINRGTNTCDMTNIDKYIALSADATAPAVTDTTVASELTTNGLGRAAGTYAHTNGTATYTEVNTFTATGTQASIQKSGLLTKLAVGTLVFENTFSSTNVISGDTLQVTWTVTL